MTINVEKDDRHLIVTFEFDGSVPHRLKKVPGYKFVPKEKGGPHWQYPLEFQVARQLRAEFGKEMRCSKEVLRWGENQSRQGQELLALALADAATLERLPAALPALYRAVHAGPRGRDMTVKELDKLIKAEAGSFQTADISYLAAAANPLNGNQPGLGKTLETIGAIFEQGIDDGPHLVLAPLTSLATVWKTELERWQEYPVWVCDGNSYNKSWTINDFMGTEGAGWLICNHHMAQYKRIVDETGRTETQYIARFPELYELEWATITLDEVHKAGFRDTNSLMFRGINDLRSHKRFALSGTPIGGKPENLWTILHWLNPEEFSSKWRWIDLWLEVTTETYQKQGQERSKKNVGKIRPEREEEFYKAHAPYFLRRLKKEVLPELPDKLPVDIWVEMSGKQEQQYEQMALEAEVRIEDEHLSATSILAEYTRLKQFAIALNTVKYLPDSTWIPIPTRTSCKLDALEQLLEERGVFEGDVDEQVVVFSQFSKVVDMLYEWLQEKNVKVLKLTGDTNKKGQREEIQKSFQAGEASVIVMTTTAGGVSITLDAADTVVFMDETWDPGDQEQAEDRIHRASRIHQVTCYYIRTKGTIEQYIQSVLLGKENVNRIILDLRRAGLRATDKVQVNDAEG